MNKGRLEAFSDGVIAILITIMVLELKVPEEATLQALVPLVPEFLTYLVSFIYLAIYWNNHHHLLHAAGKINGKILWANMHLLFWLSLVPFATGWMGRNQFAHAPTAAYGIALFMAAVAYYLLQSQIVAASGRDSGLAKALGRDLKGKISPVLYATSIVFAFLVPAVSAALYVVVALMWLIPDRRLEQTPA